MSVYLRLVSVYFEILQPVRCRPLLFDFWRIVIRFSKIYAINLSEALAWEQCKLQNVLNVNSGRDYKGIGLGNIPVYGTGGYMLSIAQALSYDRDAIGIGRKGTINKPYVLKAPFWTVDTLFYAVPCNPNSLNFLYAFFQTVDWTKKDESTGVPSLSKDAINETLLKIPVKEEQEEIGNFFQKLTGLITLHQREPNLVK